jgi:phosphate transport system substrate-binding protein
MTSVLPLHRIALAVVAAGSMTVCVQALDVDAALPSYTKTDGVSGNITLVGSDTMGQVVGGWLDAFKKIYPAVTSEMHEPGSGKAVPSLIEGTATFGPMSRSINKAEIDSFEEKFGYKPTGIVVAIDVLAVYVHRDNPIKGLSLTQLDAVWSKTRKGGATADVTTWGSLGVEGDLASQAISLYGRNSSSGTHQYFKEKALAKGDFKSTVKEQPGSAGVVSAVANEKNAMGYSGIGYMTADVKAVPLSKKDGEAFIAPTPENLKTYPLARDLYLAANVKPGSTMGVLRREFLKFVFSKEGQTIVVEKGFLPMAAVDAAKQLEAVGVK